MQRAELSGTGGRAGYAKLRPITSENCEGGLEHSGRAWGTGGELGGGVQSGIAGSR